MTVREAALRGLSAGSVGTRAAGMVIQVNGHGVAMTWVGHRAMSVPDPSSSYCYMRAF